MTDAGSKTQFDLDISGVAGFFGGDVSVSAMATVHIYEGRKWLGWYNQPGSYEIAKRYGQLSRSRFWTLFTPVSTLIQQLCSSTMEVTGPRSPLPSPVMHSTDR